jgi:hypothetical protein
MLKPTLDMRGTNVYMVKGKELGIPCWAFLGADMEHVRWYELVFDEAKARRYHDYYLKDSREGKHKYKFYVNETFYLVDKDLRANGFVKD